MLSAGYELSPYKPTSLRAARGACLDYSVAQNFCNMSKIRTDFEKLIRAEVVVMMTISHAKASGAKEQGKWRLEGKDYIVANGDVIHFRFNV